MSAFVGSAVFSGTASAVTRSCLDRPVTLRMPLAVCELIWTLALAVLVAVESLWLPMLWRWRAQCFPTSSWDVWTASLQLFLLFNFGDCGRVNGNCNQTKSRIELYCKKIGGLKVDLNQWLTYATVNHSILKWQLFTLAVLNHEAWDTISECF